jgi:hypothetical protein
VYNSLEGPRRQEAETWLAEPMRLVARQHAQAFDDAISQATKEHGVCVCVCACV